MCPDALSPDLRSRASEINDAAVRFLAAGQTDAAIDALDDALAADPLHPEATYNQAMLLWQRRACSDADVVERLTRVVRNRPGQWRPHYLLGLAHAARRDAASAVAALAEALRLAPAESAPAQALAAVEAERAGWPACVCSLSAHPKGMLTAAFSPDGSRLLTSGSEDATCLWDVASGECLRTIEQGAGAWSVAFAADGKSAVIPKLDELRIWDLEAGTCLKTWKPSFSFGVRVGSWHSHVSFHPDGRRVVAATSDGEIRIWDPATGKSKTVAASRQPGVCERAALSADGSQLLSVSGMVQGVVMFSDLSNGHTTVAPLHAGGLSSLAIVGTYVLTGSYDGTACLWDGQTGNIVRTFRWWRPHTEPIAFLQAGKYALTEAHSDGAHIWDLTTGRAVRTLENGAHWDPAAFLAGDVRFSGEDRSTADYEKSLGSLTPKRAEDSVTAVALSPDRRLAATGTHGGRAFLWDVGSGQCLRTFDGYPRRIEAVAFTPDSRRLLIAGAGAEYGRNCRIDIWELGDLTPPRFTPVTAVPASAEQRESAADATLLERIDASIKQRKWNDARDLLRQAAPLPGHDRHPQILASFLRSGHYSDHVDLPFVRTLRGHSGPINTVAMSPDGRRALTAGDDGTMRIWDLVNVRPMQVLAGAGGPIRSAAYSGDGQRIITVEGDQAARLYDVSSGRNLLSFRGGGAPVESVALSRNGQGILTAEGNRVTAWDVRSGQMKQFSLPDQVAAVAFSQADALVATFGGGFYRINLRKGELNRVTGFGPVRAATVFSAAGPVSANDAALACAGDGACRMWDISHNKWAGFARGHVGNVVAVSACTAGESVPTKHVVT
ncbi:MAG: tetratricopeptide repeat protein, partial [Chloroflexota bacterium]